MAVASCGCGAVWLWRRVVAVPCGCGVVLCDPASASAETSLFDVENANVEGPTKLASAGACESRTLTPPQPPRSLRSLVPRALLARRCAQPTTVCARRTDHGSWRTERARCARVQFSRLTDRYPRRAVLRGADMSVSDREFCRRQAPTTSHSLRSRDRAEGFRGCCCGSAVRERAEGFRGCHCCPAVRGRAEGFRGVGCCFAVAVCAEDFRSRSYSFIVVPDLAESVRESRHRPGVSEHD